MSFSEQIALSAGALFARLFALIEGDLSFALDIASAFCYLLFFYLSALWLSKTKWWHRFIFVLIMFFWFDEMLSSQADVFLTNNFVLYKSAYSYYINYGIFLDNSSLYLMVSYVDVLLRVDDTFMYVIYALMGYYGFVLTKNISWLLELYITNVVFLVFSVFDNLLEIEIDFLDFLVLVVVLVAYLEADSYNAWNSFLILNIFQICLVFLLFTHDFISSFVVFECITVSSTVSALSYCSIFSNIKTYVFMLRNYFLLNVFVALIFLYGFVWLTCYWLASHGDFFVSFYDISKMLETYGAPEALYKVFFFLICVVLVFKLVLAPQAIWAINIYSNVPMSFLAVIMVLYKLVMFLFFIDLFSFMKVFETFVEYKNVVISAVGLSSIVISGLAFKQVNLKTILAYTTVSNFGFVLMNLIFGSLINIQYSLIYLFFYSLTLFSIFLILFLVEMKFPVVFISQLHLVKNISYYYYYTLVFCFFSLAGIPPTAGFFIKYFLLRCVFDSQLYLLLFFGVFINAYLLVVYLVCIKNLLDANQIGVFVGSDVRRYANLLHSATKFNKLRQLTTEVVKGCVFVIQLIIVFFIFVL